MLLEGEYDTYNDDEDEEEENRKGYENLGTREVQATKSNQISALNHFKKFLVEECSGGIDEVRYEDLKELLGKFADCFV